MMGAIHEAEEVVLVGASQNYLKSDMKKKDDDEQSYRERMLGPLLPYDRFITDCLNSQIEYELSNHDEAVRWKWSNCSWGVFRCDGLTEKQHPFYWEPECHR